jgi:predicted nucleic acid-binding protein
MEPAILGLVLDSSVLVAAERARLTTTQVIKSIRASVGDVPIVVCALTVAELAHGIYRANSPERSEQRRQFLDELKAHVPAHPVTEATAEIIARIGGER